MTRVTVQASDVGRTCPYCRFPLKGADTAERCDSCGGLHHEDCWQEGGGCAAFGCEGGGAAQQPARPQALPPVVGAPPQPSYAASPQWQAPAPQQWGAGVAGSAGSNGKAVASMVLGIIGLVVCPIICSILAIVFGKQAQGELARNPAQSGEGMASAGVVMGWIGTVVYGLLILVSVAAG